MYFSHSIILTREKRKAIIKGLIYYLLKSKGASDLASKGATLSKHNFRQRIDAFTALGLASFAFSSAFKQELNGEWLFHFTTNFWGFEMCFCSLLEWKQSVLNTFTKQPGGNIRFQTGKARSGIDSAVRRGWPLHQQLQAPAVTGSRSSNPGSLSGRDRRVYPGPQRLSY